ncbi:hypothetical protein ALC60_10819, partial [Trachymyrmex zeteki]
VYLHYFGSSAKLEIHSEDCGKVNDCAIRMPSEDNKWLSFSNHCRKERVPFVIYADLECSLEKMDRDPNTSTYTIGYYTHCSYDDSLLKYRFRRDKDCMTWFIEELRNLAHNVQSILTKEKYISFTKSCITSYELDPAYYYTLSDFTWDMLKYTGVKFELLTDIDMVMFIERCIRGGLSQCSNRYAQIEFNTKFRTLAKNEFEKNLYKLMNNAVFGKTMENVRNHVNVRLVIRWDEKYGAETMIAKPNFHSKSGFFFFPENLVAIEMRDMCILDISKTCLYEFHHEYMASLYHEKCKIMYTETDSLIYHIECDNVYDILKRDINIRSVPIMTNLNSNRCDHYKRSRNDN